MATEEVSRPPNLPPYSEMILAAITALDEKGGSNRSAISKYMESTYGELPESHPSLLTAHLARMKESSELIVVKNNYLRPGPGEAPKRGRGRPPKPKPALPEGQAVSPPRPRGRPPKPKDPLAAAVAKAASGFLPPSGRTLKKARPSPVPGEEPPAAAAATATATATGSSPPPGVPVKRGRGRPPKVKPPVAEVGV